MFRSCKRVKIMSSGLESVINNNGKVKNIKFYSTASHQPVQVTCKAEVF